MKMPFWVEMKTNQTVLVLSNVTMEILDVKCSPFIGEHGDAMLFYKSKSDSGLQNSCMSKMIIVINSSFSLY